MDKVKEAQILADKLIDECICQVGDNKGALKDEPESVKKSEEDIKKAVAMKEEKEVKVSDVPKDKQKIFKIRRGLARIKGGKLPKARHESDQVKIAQKKDTLFDNLERVVKDRTKKDSGSDPTPTTEGSMLSKLQSWGKKKMNKKRAIYTKGNKKGNALMKRNAALAAASGDVYIPKKKKK